MTPLYHIVETRGIYGEPVRETFCTHYFNGQGDEVGLQLGAFPDSCQVFIPPRKWGDAMKGALSAFPGVPYRHPY